MANRQNGGKYNKAGNQNQLGLKEAYTVLQRDFLELKKAYIGNEQQLVEMQQQYLILQQSYQVLQQNSQDQQASLLEKLEKSYDAFNEKFTRVEELEEQLNKRKKNDEESNDRMDDKVKGACLQLQDQINQLNFQRQLLEEAVQNSLANVGLSLVKVNGDFEIKILDHKKLRQLAGFSVDRVNSAATSEKIADLEEGNALLQQKLLSLKEYSENQRKELSKTSEMLKKKTEECSIMKRNGNKGTILIERKALERIVNRLADMSDFVVELKKTIFDQNSWIDMLRDALNEYKLPQSSKQGANKTSVGNVPPLKNKQPFLNTGKRPDTSGGKQNSFNTGKKTPKVKTKNARQKKVLSDNRFGATSGSAGAETLLSSVLQPSVKDDKELQEFQDYVHVVLPSRERSIIEQVKDTDSDIHRFKSLSLQAIDSRIAQNMEPKSLQRELYQMSNSVISGRDTRERFETDSEGYFSLGLVNDSPCEIPVASTIQDMCPMCNLIFETNCDLKKRRSHINSHFTD